MTKRRQEYKIHLSVQDDTPHACNAERKVCRMKIEKVNENQIRCTLTKEDLISRELKISELAYGTEKAKTLFRDMMRQANFEFGFEAEDIPLMIEAIPLNAECIVLIITKVEDPEELDTRFSRFAPSVTEDSEYNEELEELNDAASDDVLDLFRRLQPDPQEAEQGQETGAEHDGTNADERTRTRIFQIGSLQLAMEVSAVIASRYHGKSTLYKDTVSDTYLMVMTQGDETREGFDRACNIVSEYGTLQRAMSASGTFLAEHCEALVKDNAVQALGGL